MKLKVWLKEVGKGMKSVEVHERVVEAQAIRDVLVITQEDGTGITYPLWNVLKTKAFGDPDDIPPV